MEHILLFSLLFVLSLSKAASLPPNRTAISMYDVIIKQCNGFKFPEDYKDQAIFHSCKDWDDIQSVTEVTANRKVEILCLIYYDTIVHQCKTKTELKVYADMKEISGYSLDTVCHKLSVIQLNSAEINNQLNKIIKNEDQCKYVCSDELGFANSICRISYHYGNLAKSEADKIVTSVKIASGDQVNAKINTTQHQLKTSKNETLNVIAKADLHQHLLKAANASIPAKNNQTVSAQAEDNHILNNPQPSGDENNKIVNSAIEIPKADTNQIGSNNIEQQQTKNEIINNPEPPVVESNQNPKIAVDPPQTEQIIAPDNTASKDTDPTKKNPPIATSNKQEEQEQDNLNEKQISIETDAIDDEYEGVQTDTENGFLQNKPSETVVPIKKKPYQTIGNKFEKESVEINDDDDEIDGDSYFFTYFMMLSAILIVGYICYHNKQKILALFLEGRRGRKQLRGRRPNSANYHKLNSNLEEAITSSCSKTTSNVIY